MKALRLVSALFCWLFSSYLHADFNTLQIPSLIAADGLGSDQLPPMLNWLNEAAGIPKNEDNQKDEKTTSEVLKTSLTPDYPSMGSTGSYSLQEYVEETALSSSMTSSASSIKALAGDYVGGSQSLKFNKSLSASEGGDSLTAEATGNVPLKTESIYDAVQGTAQQGAETKQLVMQDDSAMKLPETFFGNLVEAQTQKPSITDATGLNFEENTGTNISPDAVELASNNMEDMKVEARDPLKFQNWMGNFAKDFTTKLGPNFNFSSLFSKSKAKANTEQTSLATKEKKLDATDQKTQVPTESKENAETKKSESGAPEETQVSDATKTSEEGVKTEELKDSTVGNVEQSVARSETPASTKEESPRQELKAQSYDGSHFKVAEASTPPPAAPMASIATMPVIENPISNNRVENNSELKISDLSPSEIRQVQSYGASCPVFTYSQAKRYIEKDDNFVTNAPAVANKAIECISKDPRYSEILSNKLKNVMSGTCIKNFGVSFLAARTLTDLKLRYAVTYAVQPQKANLLYRCYNVAKLITRLDGEKNKNWAINDQTVIDELPAWLSPLRPVDENHI